MNNLKSNMYIRTKEGKIDKVLEINTEDFEEPTVRLASYPIGMYQGMFEYKKASYNIIDLIEVGDYANGVMIESMNNSIKPIPTPQYKNECGEYVDYDENEIKSIVTKEQFSQMEYKVGE